MTRTLLLAAAMAAAFPLPAFADPQDVKVISAVQEKLGVSVDGRMGPKTQAAIREFQRAKGLAAAGELDKPTLTALGLGGPKPAPVESNGAKPTTPVGPEQSSAERTAEPRARHDAPTGN